jgi:tripartite-type tricarboxylate transporter receptor subunit TctC
VVIALIAGWMTHTHAQTYPAKPVRIVVGFSPGGVTDVTARLISHKLADVTLAPNRQRRHRDQAVLNFAVLTINRRDP